MTKEISPKDTFRLELDTLFPPVEDESRILIGCLRNDYSASTIARAVEDCNAHVLNLNVTGLSAEHSDFVVDLRVNHRNADAVTRSLARYGYNVLDARSSNEKDNERMRDRANELLRYISV